VHEVLCVACPLKGEGAC